MSSKQPAVDRFSQPFQASTDPLPKNVSINMFHLPLNLEAHQSESKLHDATSALMVSEYVANESRIQNRVARGTSDREAHRGLTAALCCYDSKLIKVDFTWDHLHTRRLDANSLFKGSGIVARENGIPVRIVLTALLL